jgi:hypothetical protein
MAGMKEIHRDYRIIYLKDNRQAWIWAPGQDLPMLDVIERREGEAFEGLRCRTFAMIDSHVVRHGV